MSLHSWLQNVRSTLGHGERHHQQRGSIRAARHRLNVEVLEARLTPGFVATYYPPGAGAPQSLPRLADFTSDGIDDRIDILDWKVAVWPGRGDGTFADPIRNTATNDVVNLAVDDFNGDGRLDVFVVEGGGAGDFGSSW